MKLRDYQQRLVSDVFAHWAAGRKRVILQSGTGTGKCLVRGTRVLMHDGTTKAVEDVQAGDLLMGDDSAPRRVLSTCTGIERCYDIIPTKGEKWGCNESHILSLKWAGKSSRRWKKGMVYDIELRDYLALSKSDKHGLKQYRTGVQYPEREVAVDPYFLGLWLGDGTSSKLEISCPDTEITECLQSHGKCSNIEKRAGKCPVWRFKRRDNPELCAAFKSLGVFGEKHIPGQYKVNSAEVRLSLLAGIIDTDGHYCSGIYEVIAKSDRLAADIVELCRSLGFAAYMSEKKVKLKGWADYRAYNRITISGDLDRIPCRVKRKKARPRRQKRNVLHTGFQVHDRGEERYFGFEIDGNRRFLLADFTVTHNTVMFNHVAALAANKGYRVLIVADRRELISQAWNRLRQASGINAGVIMSGVDPAHHLQVQIASVQTLNRRTFPPDISLVVIDECRGSVSPSYAPIFEKYSDAYFLGVDATPVRTNGQGFDHLYDAMVCGPTIKEMEQAGALVPALTKVNPISPLLLERVKVTAGDYNEGELERAMMDGSLMAGLVSSKAAHAPGLKTIVFAVGVAHSKAIVERYNAAGIKAAHVDGGFSLEERARAFKSFEQGDVEVLSNVGIATYGYDFPGIMCVQLARPTKSVSLYLQMVGRGARPFALPDGTKKERYILLDHANCRIEHGAPNADRKWSLKGKKSSGKKKEGLIKLIMPDGEECIVPTREIPQDIEGVTLVDVDESTFDAVRRQRAFDAILSRVRQKGHKPISAYFQFVQSNRDYTLQDLEYIARKMNFKPGWARYKWQERQGA